MEFHEQARMGKGQAVSYFSCLAQLGFARYQKADYLDHDTSSSMPMRENLELVKIERSCEVTHTSWSRDVWLLDEP